MWFLSRPFVLSFPEDRVDFMKFFNCWIMLEKIFCWRHDLQKKYSSQALLGSKRVMRQFAAAIELENEQSRLKLHRTVFAYFADYFLCRGAKKSDYVCQLVCTLLFFPETIQLAHMPAGGGNWRGSKASGIRSLQMTRQLIARAV